MNNLKKVSIILLISLIFNIFYPIIANAADTGVEAQFEDPWLFHMIKDQPEFINAGYILESDSTTNKIKFSSKAINEGIKDLQNLDVGHKVKSLKGIEVFKNLETLNFPDNEIEDITPLQNLTKLKGIGLNGNKIKNIASLSKLTNLYQLVLDHNQIEDISALKNLTNLQEVNLGYNCISDVSPLDGKKMNNLYLNNQTVTGTITNEATGIKLPKIFQQALDPNSLGYMNIIEYNNQGTNCSTDSKGNTIKLTKDSEAIHTIKYQMNYKGPTDDKENEITKKGLHGSMFIVTVDRIPLRLEGEVERNKELTNQNVDAKATFNKEVTVVSPTTWTVDPNNKKVVKRKPYTENIKEVLKVKDVAGNELPVTIDVTNIDKTPPTITNTTTNINQEKNTVEIIYEISEKIQSVNGWTLENDGKRLKKTFTKPGTEKIILKDETGNTTEKNVVINQIEELKLTATVEYSNDQKTKDNVIVTIKSNKELGENIKVGQTEGPYKNLGWNRSADKKILTKEYTGNVTENITIYDSEGTPIEKPIEVKITNIDKIKPTVTIQYIPSKDKTSVQAILRVNEEIKDISGWEKIEDKYVKLYTTNGDYTVDVYDLAGNKTTETITIDQIEEKKPENFDVEVRYTPEAPTIARKVTVTIISPNELKELNGWDLSADKKTLTKDYDRNINETVTVTDINGNIGTALINIGNINNEPLEIIGVDYSTKELTNKDVKVTIKANHKLNQLNGWDISADKKEISKSYSRNVNNEKVQVTDELGNPGEATININNIDKDKPQVEIEYSEKDKKVGEVTVTIKANEEIKQAKGWKLSSDKKSLTKRYVRNATEILTVYDLAGNDENVTIDINNIERVIDWKQEQQPDGSVKCTITSDYELNEIDGWTLSNDKKTLTKIYYENTEETVKVSDVDGNEYEEIKIKITGIKKDNNNNNQNSGKNEDPTTAQGKLPNAGTGFIIISLIAVMAVVAIILKRKLIDYKDVK